MDAVYVVFPGNEQGGAATHLLAYARAVSKKESTIIRFISLGNGPLFDKIQHVISNVLVVDGGVRQQYAKLVKLMKQADKQSIWHAHGPRTNVLVGLAAKNTRSLFTSTIHSDPEKDFLGSWLKSQLFPKINRWILGSAVGLFVGSHSFSRYFNNMETFYVPNAIERSGEGVCNQKNWRTVLQVPNAFFIGVVARLDPVKSIETAVEAFAMLRPRTTAPVHLILAGSGSEELALRTLVKQLGVEPWVHFIGFVEPIDSVFQSIDIHVLPSKSEGESPYVILEAGKYGVPTVGSDIKGIRNLIQDKETGRLFEVADSAQLACVIEEMIQSPEDRNRYVENFRMKILPKYSEDAMLSAYETGYQAMRLKWSEENV